ncbi:hypothetical protein NQ314_010071 [Rhamnusium bicolor]|uniref:MADF domain-containing protein n=1 Tax=Rhamnusium bicolor TaxID=1586634 RepID=A0AAV8XU91_9CUCU|nr:hypothetical protein NQ314_010071 [Rhamnusium bicolor]
MATQSQWTNEKVLEILELYQAEPLLWNPTHRQHKNRNAVADAWQRVQSSFSLPCAVPDLKKKRESLMTTYRTHNNRTKQSIRSGAGTDELFKSNWFAYDLMDSFLGPIYNKNNTSTVNTEVSK